MTIDLIALRRELHQIPEVGLQLPLTQARILEALEGLPLEITLGRSVTSVVGVLRGGKAVDGERPVVLLREDMDGLPVEELTGLEFASTNGAMHGCGHDLHMSMLVGAAHELCERRDELTGDVIFMFQPGEEGADGCRYMLEEGVLDVAGPRPERVYGIHVWSALDPCGTFSTKHGTVMASSDEVRVRMLGRGGHGSSPHRAADPVPALAELATTLQTVVTRQFDVVQDPVVIGIGLLQAGTMATVIPEEGRLAGTVRAFSRGARDKAVEMIPKVADSIAAVHGVEAEFELIEQYPVTVNNDEQADLVADVVADLFGDDRHVRWQHALPAAEDFSRLLETAPGCFIGLSACPPELDPATAPFNHSAYARFDDSVVPDGARLLAELALRHLA